MSNAILMASGMGTRMRPITDTKPKPLVEINGVPLIETVIDALNLVAVENIYVVVGYLAEQFQYLEAKYSNLQLIQNKDYSVANNISSLFYAAKHLEDNDCYICEADLYLPDKSILSPTPAESCYYGCLVNGWSTDWVFELDNGSHICRVGKGGADCYNMVGIAHFKQREAKLIAQKIKQCYALESYRDKFWDEVVDENLKELQLIVNPISHGKIIEIDTVEELEAVRSRYSPLTR